MNVKINFEDNNELLNGILSLVGEWPFPALPRIGEEISPSLLKEWITPHELFEALTDEEKAMWVRWVSEDVEAGSQEEEAQQDNLYIWLANIGTIVSEVCWSKYEGQYSVLITLKAARLLRD